MDDALHLFTIYQNPSDYPGRFVVRESIVAAGRTVLCGPPRAVVSSLEEARAAVPDGLYRLQRFPEDDPVVVEVWL